MLRFFARAGAVSGTFVVTFMLLMPAGCRTGTETGRRECDNLLGISTSAPLTGLVIALVTATLLVAAVAYLVRSRVPGPQPGAWSAAGGLVRSRG